ncbi:hypothetical protein [Pedobacter sp. ASV12]|uniref:hypothetical protein n=1 Tax=Pedobacter sp. ASV12 TaxID=2795120 RepID=UPI0018EAC7BE|nr:hypothetical protein [Pedobacter sp. ASV12]
MKKTLNLGKALSKAEQKSILGGGNEFVVIQCSNGAVVCISCDEGDDCGAIADAACAAAGNSES